MPDTDMQFMGVKCLYEWSHILFRYSINALTTGAVLPCQPEVVAVSILVW